MFVDRVEIEVAAGDGGNGVVAWRREKYIPKGGPAGGDGGHGGSVRLYVDPNTFGLERFRHTRVLIAERGGKGGSSCCKGKNGNDAIIKIPPGTLVRDIDTKEILFDGTTDHEEFVLCRGGRGGRGNAQFRSSTNRAPNVATSGEPGERRRVELELKLIGDVGFVGFPNAGKSSLFTKMTYAKVEIGAYPFTTLTPNIGFISYGADLLEEIYRTAGIRTADGHQSRRIVVTDIPGIIEDAHQNRGLGLQFLRHIERTRALLYILDAAAVDGRDPISDYRVLREELRAYDPQLLTRPSCVVLNKCDLETAAEQIAAFRADVSHPCIIEVSAETGEGLAELKAQIALLDYGIVFEG